MVVVFYRADMPYNQTISVAPRKIVIAVRCHGTRTRPAFNLNFQVGVHEIPLPLLGHGAARDGVNIMSCSRKQKYPGSVPSSLHPA